MPQDVGEQHENTLAVWIWDLGLRRIRAANAPALALWGAESEVELFTRVFGSSDPMTRAGVEAYDLIATGEAQVHLSADIAGRAGVRLHVDQPTQAAHLLRCAHRLSDAPPPRAEPDLPDTAFAAAPFAMTVLDAQGQVVSQNPAALALFGPTAQTLWRERHVEPPEADAALTHALATGGGGYVARLAVLGGRRRLSINLTALAGPERRLLASATPIPSAEGGMLSGNAAEDVLHAAPSALAVFSLETEELLYANAAALALTPAFEAPTAGETTLASLFADDLTALRQARSDLLIDTRQSPRTLDLAHPADAGARLAVETTIGFWRGSSAYFLWFRPSGAAPSAPAATPSAPVVAPIPTPPRPVEDADRDGAQHATRIARAAVIARASHAMRTNATSVRGFAELLLSSDHDPDEAEEKLRDILTATDALSAALESLLADLSRLED